MTTEASNPFKFNVDFDGTNFLFWSQSLATVLKGKNLWKTVTGETKKPTVADKIAEQEQTNHQIIAWIRNNQGYFLSQIKFASEFLNIPYLFYSKVSNTPLALNVKLRPTDGEPLPDATLYHQLVGMLTYLTLTHPDIAYAVHVVSQFMHAPRIDHYSATLRIIRYL